MSSTSEKKKIKVSTNIKALVLETRKRTIKQIRKWAEKNHKKNIYYSQKSLLSFLDSLK